MKIKEIAKVVEKISPMGLALDWDNVGFLVGDEKADIKRILLTIDITKEVLREAKKLKTDLILSYHPVIWDGLKDVTAGGKNGIVYELIRSGIGVYSIHTGLDIAWGGVNDGLAEMVGIENSEPIGDYVPEPNGGNFKVVVFVPRGNLVAVSNAMFAAGAGAIGNYSHCGFQIEGQGSFLPLEGARPAIGKKGKLEKVEEIRFESIVPAGKLAAVVEAMKKAHTYETPAYDCIKLYQSKEMYGLGRVGYLREPASMKEIIARIKRQTGARAMGFVGEEKRIIRKAAVCAGYCGMIINKVIDKGCDLYLTGELKHHQAMAAQEASVSCICLSHSVSERFILKKVAKQLQKELKEVTIGVSKKDADPFTWKQL
jgi:dinuclear metal center YbgI/SA1388 family protein